jgi:hypothetical protein
VDDHDVWAGKNFSISVTCGITRRPSGVAGLNIGLNRILSAGNGRESCDLNQFIVSAMLDRLSWHLKSAD